jgi:uncharacterized membrane protein
MYCFFGWIFETTYVSLKTHHFVNRGFLHGPFLPLYGSGAIMVLFVALPLKGNYVAQYIAGALTATLLEYFTGIVMEAIFKVRYWDYSDQKFNLKGYICLGSSVVWGFLTLLLVNVIHKPVEKLLFLLHPEVCSLLAVLLTILNAVDFTISFREAIQLRDMMFYLERAKDEFEDMKARMYRRMDVVAAVVDDEITQKIQDNRRRLVENILNRHPTLHSDRFHDMIEELKKVKRKR